MSRQDFTEHLQGILDDTKSGSYIGGSLCLENAWLNTNGIAYWENEGSRSLTQKERLLVCQVYLKYKTPNHAFWNECKEFVEKNIKS